MKWKIIAAYLRGFSKWGGMAFSSLEYLFSLLEIFTILYCADEKSDDVIRGSTKTVQRSIENISRNITAAFFKLDTRNAHHK